MRIIVNMLWWLFGGLKISIVYFMGSIIMTLTIIGIPIALQTFKIGMLCLCPFGAEVKETNVPPIYIRIPLNILWIILFGIWICFIHITLGVVMFITIIGIPFAKQHFKMAKLSLAPFGKDVELHL